MTKAAGLILLFIFLAHLSFGQLDNKAFYRSEEETDTMVAKQFSLHLEHLNFLKNNEYFTKITDGYTLFGMQLIPNVRYQVNEKFSLEAGCFFQKDYGQKGIREILPLFSARYHHNRHQLIMGNLDGGLQHNLIEPLYEFENQLNRRVESGIQYKYQRPGLRLDSWVDWRTMIYPSSPVQEEILAGFNVEPVLIAKGPFSVAFSLQGTIYHKGGQIDTTGIPLTTWFHTTGGLKLGYNNPGSGPVKSIQIQAFGVSYLDNSTTQWFSYASSLSPYLNASVNTKWATLMLSYWQSTGFPSYQGGRLYRTVSSNIRYPNYQEKNRQLLFVRLMKDFKLGPGIWITARIEPYFDLQNNLWEFSHGLYINYRGNLWKSRS